MHVLLPSMKCVRALLFSVSLSFFCEVAVGVGASEEREQSAPAQTAPQQAGFGSQTERLLFFLGKPRTKKGSRFALARLLNVKYGYHFTGQSGMPVQQYDSTAGEGRPTAQQPSIGCGLPGPYGGDVYGKPRRPISVYRRMSPLASEPPPRLNSLNVKGAPRH